MMQLINSNMDNNIHNKELWDTILQCFEWALENECKRLDAEAEIFGLISLPEGSSESLYCIIYKLDPIKALDLYLQDNGMNITIKEIEWAKRIDKGESVILEDKERDLLYTISLGVLMMLAEH